MGRIEAFRAFRVVEDVAVPGTVQESALIDAADGFPQTEETVLRRKLPGERHLFSALGKGEKRYGVCFRRQGKDDRVGGDRRTECVFPDHRKTSFLQIDAAILS